MDRRFDAVDRRFKAVDRRFDAMDQRFDAMDQRFDAFDSRFAGVDARFDVLEARVMTGFASLSEKLDDVLASMKSVVEGVPTTKSLVELSRRLGVDMPITSAVHAILFENLSPAEAIRGLMGREPKVEKVG